MKEKKKMGLGVRILLGMVLGIIVGAILWALLGVDKANEIATAYIKPFGDIFVNLLKYIVVPLVLLSIMDGVISMGDIGKVGKIGWKTVVYFLATTAIACVIGLVVANIFKGSFRVLEMAEDAAYEAKNANIVDTVKGIFPSNFIQPLLDSSMLQIIVIALFFGCGILVAGEKGKLAADVVSSFNEVTQKVMSFILAVSPIGVFCLMTWVVSNQGPKILGDLGLVLLAAYIGYIIHVVVVYGLSVRFLSGMNPLKFFKGLAPAMICAFTTTSSNATLPLNIECCNKMGAEPEISAFVLPLGATINMDGTAIYQAVCAVFIACCYGVELTLGDMAMIVLTATLASVGTAGVSGAGMIMLAMVLTQVGLPVEGIAIIAGVDKLFDMGRTTLNITGDATCALFISRLEREKAAKKAAKAAK